MRKFVCILAAIIVLFSCTLFFVACNKEEVVAPTGDFLADIAKISTRPDYESLFSAGDVALIRSVLDETASLDEKKDAVMTLYDTANRSRISENKGLSLMVQDSLGGSAQGRVYMHGFTLQYGDKWYYQLASQAAEGDVAGFEALAELLSPIAGNLQVAYTGGDGKYHYAYIMGSDTQLDCSVTTFPYASYIIPEGDEPKVYDSFEAYQDERNCRDSQLELNNMRIYKSLLNDDDLSIEYNEAQRFYTVKFSINCTNQDSDEFWDFQLMSKRDLDTGTFLTINNTIVGWRAEVEIWDNGYVKAFRSYEDWKMRVIGNDIDSHPQNKFEYLWKADEIVSVISQNENIKSIMDTYLDATDEEIIDHAIDYYSDPQSVYVFDWFTFWIALAASVVGVIIIVIVILAILVKVGKAPKLEAALKRMAQKDRERRQAIKDQDAKDKEEKKERKVEKKEARAEKRDERRDARAAKHAGDTSVDEIFDENAEEEVVNFASGEESVEDVVVHTVQNNDESAVSIGENVDVDTRDDSSDM